MVRSRLFLLVAWSLVASPAWAADLVEPWPQGFSDLELSLLRAGDSGATDVGSVAGFGVMPSLSLGVSVGRHGDGSSRHGLIGIWSTEVGSAWEIDLCGEVGLTSANGESELSGTDWLLGTELSFHRLAVVPYWRATVVGDPESGGFHGLAGLMIPVAERLELHVELSSEAPEEGRWPLHIAVGPNFRVTESVEILPEISMLHEPGNGETSWLFSVGLVIDPGLGRRE